jgi:hypothetical protein
MHGCPRCGAPNPPAQKVCAVCGLPLPEAPGSKGPSVAKRTLFGMGDAAPQAPEPKGVALKDTLLGHAAPPVAPPVPNAVPVKTMLGLPPLTTPEPPKQPPQGLPPVDAEPANPAEPGARTQGGGQLPSQFKTVLGIARPGIAPMNPGVPKPAIQSPYIAPAPEPAPQAVPNRPVVVPKSMTNRLVWVVGIIVLATALGLAAIVALALLRHRQSPITATLRATDTGVESLELRCPECVDGTAVRLRGASSAFKQGSTQLALGAPLRIGDNELALQLQAPDAREATDVPIRVPVQYRVRGDFSALNETRPQLRVLIEALPQTAVVVDGHALPLDATGKAVHAIDVSPELSGLSSSVATLERVIPYTITPPGAQTRSGEIRLKIGIVPLLVSAPGDSIVVETPNFMLAGQTQPNGAVTVAGRPITVDANGQFAQLMNVSAVGETTIEVRASLANYAPRLFPLHVERVASLSAEAVQFSANATQGLTGIASDPDGKKGWAVVVEGNLLEVRIDRHTSVALLEVRKGCPVDSCWVRVLHGAAVPFAKGANVRVYGHVLGAVAGPRTGTKIPELRAQFILPGGRP